MILIFMTNLYNNFVFSGNVEKFRVQRNRMVGT